MDVVWLKGDKGGGASGEEVVTEVVMVDEASQLLIENICLVSCIHPNNSVTVFGQHFLLKWGLVN
jgi:hypothetical protein